MKKSFLLFTLILITSTSTSYTIFNDEENKNSFWQSALDIFFLPTYLQENLFCTSPGELDSDQEESDSFLKFTLRSSYFIHVFPWASYLENTINPNKHSRFHNQINLIIKHTPATLIGTYCFAHYRHNEETNTTKQLYPWGSFVGAQVIGATSGYLVKKAVWNTFYYAAKNYGK